LIALAMGARGAATRILGPSRGSFLTYASLGTDRESAPGQLDCRKLRDLYRIHQLTAETKLAGIVGSPLGHSASPEMHNAALAACEPGFVYVPFDVGDVREFVSRMIRPAVIRPAATKVELDFR